MHVGTVAAGRIGVAVLRRLKPFDVKQHYTDPQSVRMHSRIARLTPGAGERSASTARMG
jgi:lactate dehydrogenase-like 2-hydroxyacid dehydrogenase